MIVCVWPFGLLDYGSATLHTNFYPIFSLDCAPMPSTLAQSKERKGSNFAIWQPWSEPAGLLVLSASSSLAEISETHSGPSQKIAQLTTVETTSDCDSAYCYIAQSVSAALCDKSVVMTIIALSDSK